MYPVVVTKDPVAVEREVNLVYRVMFPGGDPGFVPQAFAWARSCFTGGEAGYQPIDAKYHDFEHTMQGALCMARLLQGRQAAGVAPVLSQRVFELGILAILLHDTGYLKRTGDNTGTGAKYTVIHVTRSAEFAAEFLTRQGFSPGEIRSVQNMIHCTGVDAVLEKLPFQDEMERIVGFALGTADLMGQMAAEDYIEKLPVLFAEFAEAAQYDMTRSKSVSLFASAADLMQKTPGFWEKYVIPKLGRDFGAIYEFLRRPYPDGPNEYVDRINANIDRLRRQLAGGSIG